MSVQLLPASSAGTPPQTKVKKGHLDHLDLIRVLTFASVIAVHDITFTTDSNSLTPNAMLTLLHFTRSMFFFLTGFVLVYTYRDRHVGKSFLKRRFKLVGIPYLIWSVFYFGLQLFNNGQVPPPSQTFDALWGDICKGTAWYHLYFLLVTLQFYLLFPLVIAFLRATKRRHHLILLVVSGAAQIGVTMALTYLPAPDQSTILGQLWANATSFIGSYQFYLVAGCVAAFYYREFHAWIVTHSRLIVALLLGTMVFSEVWFYTASANGVHPMDATGVLQPEMIPWYLAVILGLYALGVVWARGRTDGWMHRMVRAASLRSFGVYLVHPFMLWFFLWVDNGWFQHNLSGAWLTIAGYAFAVGVSLIFVEIVIRSPLSLALIGRERLRTTPKKVVMVPSAQAA